MLRILPSLLIGIVTLAFVTAIVISTLAQFEESGLLKEINSTDNIIPVPELRNIFPFVIFIGFIALVLMVILTLTMNDDEDTKDDEDTEDEEEEEQTKKKGKQTYLEYVKEQIEIEKLMKK